MFIKSAGCHKIHIKTIFLTQLQAEKENAMKSRLFMNILSTGGDKKNL